MLQTALRPLLQAITFYGAKLTFFFELKLSLLKKRELLKDRPSGGGRGVHQAAERPDSSAVYSDDNSNDGNKDDNNDSNDNHHYYDNDNN